MCDKAMRTGKIKALLDEGCSQTYVSQRLNVRKNIVLREHEVTFNLNKIV